MPWQTQALSDLCDINIGRTPSRRQKKYWSPGTPWLSIADMNQGRSLKVTKEQVSDVAAHEVMGPPVAPGTVALSFKLSIGKVGIVKVPMFTNEAIATLPIRNTRKLSPEFLYWVLRSINLTKDSNSAVMGQTLNKSTLSLLHIPVPPANEQHRIVDILDQADMLRAKRIKAIDKIDDLTQSIFLDMFGAPLREWQELTVADVASSAKGSIRTGPFGSQLLHEEFVDDGIAVLGIDNVVTNEFRWKERRFITEDKYQSLSRYTVRPGDVLITIMGTCGRCAVVPDSIPVAINTKHLCCITLDAERCLPEFLHSYFLMHPVAQRYLERTAKGAIMSGLNMSIIKSLPIALPPLALQREFVVKTTAIKALKASLSSHLVQLDALFASLQDRAFKGELWNDVLI